MKKNDDIFKRLNKQKPIVKSRSIQPLSAKDFPQNKKASFEAPIESISSRTFNGEPERRGKRDSSTPEHGKRAKEIYNTRVKETKREKYELDIFSEPAHIKKETKPLKEMPEALEFKTYSAPEKVFDTDQEDIEQEQISGENPDKKKEIRFRHELKYYINYRDYIMLRGMLRAVMKRDRFAGENGSYLVRSLYFDDIYESALLEKLAGNETRRKYRIRAYNLMDDNIRFEKKYKSGQYIAKSSIRLSIDEYKSIMAEDYDFLKSRKEDFAKELYLELRNNRLRPRVIVDYDREAYVFPVEEVRITFDKDLRAGLCVKDIFDRSAPMMPMYESGVMVLEVKFFKYLPEFIKKVINNLNATDRCAISKYVICRKYE